MFLLLDHALPTASWLTAAYSRHSFVAGEFIKNNKRSGAQKVHVTCWYLTHLTIQVTKWSEFGILDARDHPFSIFSPQLCPTRGAGQIYELHLADNQARLAPVSGTF